MGLTIGEQKKRASAEALVAWRSPGFWVEHSGTKPGGTYRPNRKSPKQNPRKPADVPHDPRFTNPCLQNEPTLSRHGKAGGLEKAEISESECLLKCYSIHVLCLVQGSPWVDVQVMSTLMNPPGESLGCLAAPNKYN